MFSSHERTTKYSAHSSHGSLITSHRSPPRTPPPPKKFPIISIFSCLIARRTYFPPRPTGQLATTAKNPTKAQIAQLVEQLAFNQLVLGSSPSLRTIFKKALNPTGFRAFCLAQIAADLECGSLLPLCGQWSLLHAVGASCLVRLTPGREPASRFRKERRQASALQILRAGRYLDCGF